MTRLLRRLALLTALGAGTAAMADAPPSSVAYVGATVIHGTGGAPT